MPGSEGIIDIVVFVPQGEEFLKVFYVQGLLGIIVLRQGVNLACVSGATTLQLPQGIWVIGHEYGYVLGGLHLPLVVHDAEGDIVVAMVVVESFRDGGLTVLCTD